MPAAVLRRCRPGYRLTLEPSEVDADCCERLYDEARAATASGRPADAASKLEQALALWRGSPLADFTYEPFAQGAIAQLEELRVNCREELVEAQLALGHHAEVVRELETLIADHPLRERPRGQLMLALYRCGRQAEALDAYQQARHILVEKLAIEPNADLRALEQAILQQDPSLAAPSPSRGARPEHRRSGHPRLAAARLDTERTAGSGPGPTRQEAGDSAAENRRGRFRRPPRLPRAATLALGREQSRAHERHLARG